MIWKTSNEHKKRYVSFLYWDKKPNKFSYIFSLLTIYICLALNQLLNIITFFFEPCFIYTKIKTLTKSFYIFWVSGSVKLVTLLVSFNFFILLQEKKKKKREKLNLLGTQIIIFCSLYFVCLHLCEFISSQKFFKLSLLWL